MEYLKERTFELFRYTLPGLFVILVFLNVDERVKTPLDILEYQLKDLSTEVIILTLVLSFVLGLIVDQLASRLSRMLYKKRLKPEYSSGIKLTWTEKHALLRGLASANYKQIENWNAFKGMCRNLAFGFLLLFIISLIKLILTKAIFAWVVTMIISIIGALSLASQARVYSTWAIQDIDAAVDLFDLKNKARSNEEPSA